MLDGGHVKRTLVTHWEIVLLVGMVVGYVSLALFTGTMFPIRVVGSNSMVPTLAKGDLILVKAPSVDTLDVGNIIVYDPPNPYPSPTIHRIIQRSIVDDTVYFKTKGDHNTTPDSYRITAADVHAEYMGLKLPFLGYLVLFLQTPLGIVFIIGITVLWIVYTYLIDSDSDSSEHSR